MDRERDVRNVENIWNLARSMRVAMLTLHDGEGLRARPMESLIPEGEDVVWFITDRYSPKTAEAWQNADALLTYSNQEKGEHLVMNGILAVVDDRDKLKALWNKGADMYFPNGPDDPRVVLLRFEPKGGEFWTHGGGAITFAVQYAKAKLTGSPAKLGEHARVSL